jgi:integrase
MIVEKWSKSLKCPVYYVRLRDESGHRRLYPEKHTSKKVAEQYQRRLAAEIEERRMFPDRFPKRIKLADFVVEYLKKYASKKRPKTYREYGSITGKLTKHFGDIYLDEITRYKVESYQSLWHQEVSVYMVNRELTVLKGVCTKAIDWGFLFKNPVKGVKLGKEKARMRFLTEEEQERLIEACGRARKALYLKDIVVLDLHTGLRKEELLLLKREDVLVDGKKLKVEDGKGGYRRYVPLNDTARAVIESVLVNGRSEYLFHDGKGEPFKDVKKSFIRAAERAGLKDVVFKDLRRAFATMCALRGVKPKALQNWMGHESITTTMKYYVISPEDHEQEEIKRLDGMSGGVPMGATAAKK